ncbi:hypothetical protein LSCM1_07097 [Leishmania martiniquensis]|uniref:Uncharacterized protein n=1 Tax=Leishmania martiniquensis TaxID=1580590 RepID=A0A836KTF9_9TRYP|nr:hypothetical protein LSCM1_07097 [Leishmania martiniquensis]
MKGHGPNCSAIENGVEHLYAHVKWFPAVNSLAELLEAVQAIDQLLDAAPRAGARGSESEIKPSTLAGTTVSGHTSGCRAGGHGSGAATAGCSNAPVYSVVGIQADIQWHTASETAIMCTDALSGATPHMRTGSGNDGRSAQSDRSPDAAVEGVTVSLEDFLCTLAEAAKGWRQRAAVSAAPLCSPVTVPPLRVIVKLNFKDLPAAQQLLTRAEAHTWVGLEELCRQPHSEGGTADVMSTCAPQHSLPTVLDRSTDAAATPSEAVAIELWWSADVVAQCGVTPSPLSFAAAPPSVVQGLMARTAQVLGPRIALGFSLGWVLCPRSVPAEVLPQARVSQPLPIAADVTDEMPPPRYIFYNLLEDAPAMKSFVDGFWAELRSSQHPQHSHDAVAESSGGTSLSGSAAREGVEESSGDQAALSAAPPSPASRLVKLITFPMLFESVFADVYTAKERQQAFESSVAAAASLTAAARKADETRRVASAVLAHTTKLLSASHEGVKPSAKVHMRHPAGTAAGAEPLEEALKHAAAPATTTAPSHALRVFPTFWKATRPPPHAPLGSDDDGAFQVNVDKAARVFFPNCTIDG